MLQKEMKKSLRTFLQNYILFRGLEFNCKHIKGTLEISNIRKGFKRF